MGIMKENKRVSYLRDKDSGLMAVEALIGFVVFMFSMYTIYSFIWLYMAQSKISHALSEACQSLALESYGNSRIGFSWDKAGIGLSDLIVSFVSNIEGESDSHDNFVRTDYWAGNPELSEDALQALAKERFYAYLGGGQEDAEELLKGLGVVGDVNFTGTKIEGDDLTVQINYKIKLLLGFNMFGKTEFDTGQSVTCRMWK